MFSNELIHSVFLWVNTTRKGYISTLFKQIMSIPVNTYFPFAYYWMCGKFHKICILNVLFCLRRRRYKHTDFPWTKKNPITTATIITTTFTIASFFCGPDIFTRSVSEDSVLSSFCSLPVNIYCFNDRQLYFKKRA